MKQGWEIKKLGDFCKVIAGQSPKGSSYNANGVGVEFHQGKKAFGADVIEHSNVWTTEATRLAEAGDILISVRAPVGPTNFTDREVCIGRGLAAIRCTPMVLPQFILYALKNIEDKIVGKDGAVFNSINKDMIEDLPVPMLGIAEQERIVEILDREFERIDALKANAEQNLQHAKDLFQSALKQELQPKEGWVTKTIGELSEELFAGGDVPKNALSKTITDEYNVPIYANAIEQDGLYGYTNIARVNKPSITIAGRGSGTGYIIERNGKYFPVVRLIVVVPQAQIVRNRFLYYALKSLDIKSNGSAIPQLTVPMIAQYIVNYPTLTAQDVIIGVLDELNERCKALEENYKKTIALCDDMKQALLRKAFNGEL